MKFTIHIFRNIVRITYNGCLSKVRKEFDGACITDISVLTDELHHISEYCKQNYNEEPTFSIIDYIVG